MIKLKYPLLHPNLNQIDEDIYEVENFLPEDILNYFLNKAKNANEDQWVGSKKVILDDSLGTYTSQWYKNILRLENDKFNQDLSSLVNNVFNGSHAFKNFDSVRRLRVGGKIEEHYDSQQELDVYAGLIIYLNDDFEGGELYYKFKDITHKPKANSMVIHSAKKECTHKVNEVKSGTRYFLTNFANRWNKIND